MSSNPAPSMLQVQAAGGLFMMHWAVSTPHEFICLYFLSLFKIESIEREKQFPPHLPYQWAGRWLALPKYDQRGLKGGSSFPLSPVLLIWYRLVIGLHSLNSVSVIVKVQETPELKKNLWTTCHFELNWTRFKLLLQFSCSIHTSAIIICHF